MTRAIIGRWGKNLAVRFPAEIAKVAGLSDGEGVDIVSTDEGVVIRKLPSTATVEAMFDGKTAGDWRQLYRDAFDWGEDRGRERIEE